MKRYIPVLSIAGSDSIGGAGIQADIKTISAIGCYAATAVTAVTVQDTTGVRAVHAVPPDIVEGQIRAVMDDLRPKAVKIGMVNDAATIRRIARALRDYTSRERTIADDGTSQDASGRPGKNGEIARATNETTRESGEMSRVIIVIDPVMASTSGAALMERDALETFKRELMPLADLLTPNIPEAEALTGMTLSGRRPGRLATAERTRERIDAAGRAIAREAGCAVLVKGGHITETEEKTDMLYIDAESTPKVFTGAAVNTVNTHGTGCSLSSAIAAMLARGASLTDAVAYAKRWISEAIRAGADVTTGAGHGPVNHFFRPQEMIITDD